MSGRLLRRHWGYLPKTSNSDPGCSVSQCALTSEAYRLNTSAVAFEKTHTPPGAWYALVALSVVTLYALIDGQVLALLAQSVKTDLDLSDTQLGSLRGLGSVLFSAIAVVPLGWLADRVDRRLVLAACILVWSIAVACCGLATGYWSLLLCMAFLAAGEAGLSPIVYALLPELFPERQ